MNERGCSVMQSELKTQDEFFAWARANMTAKFPEFISEETLGRIWPPPAGSKRVFDVEAAQRAFYREDMHWVPEDFQGGVFR